MKKEKLKNDSYYWKQRKNLPIEYAFLHIDDDGEFTFLVTFDSWEALKYDVYTTYEKDNDDKKVCSSTIQKFIMEVESANDNNEWHLYKKPQMTLSKIAFELVEKIFKEINQKKQLKLDQKQTKEQ